jgi:hypothetical protein
MIAKLRSAVSAALICFLLLQNQKALGWGNEGHVCINRVAAQKIPSDMPSFFRHAVAEIAYLGPEPDRWRGQSESPLKNAQEPDHFIDLERVAWLDPLPQGRYEFYRKLYEKRAAATEHPDDYLPERVGLQPYITIEIYGRLTAAFREYRALRQQHKPTAALQHAIVFYAGWLGHYVADGAQPLHTTIHYNGWAGPNPNGYTTRPGIHSQFESNYVAQNISARDFANLVHSPDRIAEPFERYVAYLKESNRLVEKVYELEKAGALSGKGSAEAFDFTTRRLAAGAQMLLDLWYTAWLESGDVGVGVLARSVLHPGHSPQLTKKRGTPLGRDIGLAGSWKPIPARSVLKVGTAWVCPVPIKCKEFRCRAAERFLARTRRLRETWFLDRFPSRRPMVRTRLTGWQPA